MKLYEKILKIILQ